MKVIFLDIDGVLVTNTQVFSGLKGRDSESGMHFFDEKCVERLNRLIQKTDAQLVLSSTWRINGLEKFNSHARKQNLIRLPIDMTPYLDHKIENSNIYSGVPRGREIKAWLKDNKGVDKFVILDDSSDMEDLINKLVHIKNGMEGGLQDIHVDEAMQFL